jgi:hypothetical protein
MQADTCKIDIMFTQNKNFPIETQVLKVLRSSDFRRFKGNI